MRKRLGGEVSISILALAFNFNLRGNYLEKEYMTFFYYVAIISAIILAFRFTNNRKSKIINSNFVLVKNIVNYHYSGDLSPGIPRILDNKIEIVKPYLKKIEKRHHLEEVISRYSAFKFKFIPPTNQRIYTHTPILPPIPRKYRPSLTLQHLSELGISREQYKDYCNFISKPTEYKYHLEYEYIKYIKSLRIFEDIQIPSEDYPNFNTWEQIGKVLKESWKLEVRINQCRDLSQKLEKQKEIAVASDVFSHYVNKYNEFISILQDEIKTGNKVRNKINDLIREYLIYIELNKLESIQVVDITAELKTNNNLLNLDFKDKYTDLCNEVKSYFDTVEEYSKIIDSFNVRW
jgi:hypothetical protein